MKIFLTGYNGFVGKHLHKKLLELGHEVVTDLRYLHTQKYSAVIHLAAKTDISPTFNADLIESNYILTKEIFKTNSRVIFASSCSSAHLTNPYAYSKRYGEHLCGLHGNAVALRFFNIYGEGATRGIVKFLMEQPDGAKITIRGPELVRDYIYISNTVRAIILAAFNPSEKLICDVGTGIGLQTMEVVNIYQRISGKTFDISVIEAGDNEPKEMISSTPMHISFTLEEGLTKLLNTKQ